MHARRTPGLGHSDALRRSERTCRSALWPAAACARPPPSPSLVFLARSLACTATLVTCEPPPACPAHRSGPSHPQCGPT